MSLDPILWALKDAPVADSLERLVLVSLAERAARADGCTAFPSRDTLAATVLADPKTVQRVLKRLEARGLIAKGDQSAARYLRADRRPVVYDLLIPYSWFPNPNRMNAERAQAGLPSLTATDRPDIAPPPERTRRADAGKARSTEITERGDSESPRHEGTLSPERGDYESRTGGLEAPRTSPKNLPTEPPLLAAAPVAAEPATAVVPDQVGGEASSRNDNHQDDAAAFVDGLPYRQQVPNRSTRDRLVAKTRDAFAGGWTGRALRRQLTDSTDKAESLAAVYLYRLGQLPDPRAVTAAVAAEATYTPPTYTAPAVPDAVPPPANALAEARAAMRALRDAQPRTVDRRPYMPTP
ncbi:helix-turn-helix domain-containing protein [Streptomyces sp. NPDC051643]|uniref:helix-turn-helix domain-containing protein n=1 Tax=Streptomyces sp. NPDC051643 TaxID=3365665 RepID=UPI00379FDCD7